MQPAEATLPHNTDILVEQFDGNSALIRHIVQIFLEDCPRQLDNLRRALASDDIDRLCTIARSMKGAVAHFGAVRATALKSPEKLVVKGI